MDTTTSDSYSNPETPSGDQQNIDTYIIVEISDISNGIAAQFVSEFQENM